jgi:hypothetical protein
MMVQGRLVDILRPLVGGASAIALVLLLDSGLQSATVTGPGPTPGVLVTTACHWRTLDGVSDTSSTAPGRVGGPNARSQIR